MKTCKRIVIALVIFSLYVFSLATNDNNLQANEKVVTPKVENHATAPEEKVAVALTVKRLIEYVMDEQKILTPQDAEKIVRSALRWSNEYEVPIPVTFGILAVESNFKPYLISKANAHGLMQIVPTVWTKEFKRLNVAGFPEDIRGLHDIDTNIKYGTKIISVLKERHKTWSMAVCKYNPGDCEKYTASVKKASIKLTWSTM